MLDGCINRSVEQTQARKCVPAFHYLGKGFCKPPAKICLKTTHFIKWDLPNLPPTSFRFWMLQTLHFRTRRPVRSSVQNFVHCHPGTSRCRAAGPAKDGGATPMDQWTRFGHRPFGGVPRSPEPAVKAGTPGASKRCLVMWRNGPKPQSATKHQKHHPKYPQIHHWRGRYR